MSEGTKQQHTTNKKIKKCIVEYYASVALLLNIVYVEETRYAVFPDSRCNCTNHFRSQNLHYIQAILVGLSSERSLGP